jgi:cytochrome b pre-mRNA-processing protein 3
LPNFVSLLKRLFGQPSDDRAAVRPLWSRVIAVARQPRWYAQLGVADTMPGRFDMVTLVLALVILRMERDPALAESSARLTELFVEDMDGQLRQGGVGDLSVGKNIGRQMKVLGGRLGALREALPHGADALRPVIERNVTLLEGADPLPVAEATLALAAEIAALDTEALLAGRFGA